MYTLRVLDKRWEEAALIRSPFLTFSARNLYVIVNPLGFAAVFPTVWTNLMLSSKIVLNATKTWIKERQEIRSLGVIDRKPRLLQFSEWPGVSRPSSTFTAADSWHLHTSSAIAEYLTYRVSKIPDLQEANWHAAGIFHVRLAGFSEWYLIPSKFKSVKEYFYGRIRLSY